MDDVEVELADFWGIGEADELTGDGDDDDDDVVEHDTGLVVDDARWRLDSSRAVRKLRIVTNWCLHCDGEARDAEWRDRRNCEL